MFTINTNVSNLFLQRQSTSNETQLSTTFSRLSSGLRINSAADDAAGLQISGRLTSQINGLNVAQRNASDGISLAQTSEGALEEVTNILFRMRDLSIQASNGSLSSADKLALNKESEQLKQELDRINKTTTFGGNQIFHQSDDSISGGANSAERNILKTLQSGVLSESEDLIRDAFGLSGDGSKLKIDLENMDGAGGTLASVSYLVPSGNNLVMTIDLDDYSTLDANKINDLKGTILHEMVHAVMANQMDLSSVPTWFAEGTAEAIRGADDRLSGDIAGLGVTAIKNQLNTVFTNNSAPLTTPTEVAGVYSGGYVTMRYLEAQLGDTGIKSMMNELAGEQTFDAALNTASGGSIANNAALQAQLMAGTTFEDFITNNMDLTNLDNGAFGGFDAAGGSIREFSIQGLSSGSTTNDFDAYYVSGDNNGDNTDFAPNSNYDPTTFSEVALADYSAQISVSGKRTTYQIGANANETLGLTIAGFNTQNLGLEAYDLTEDSQFSTSLIDDALQYVDNQRTSIGAFINRLEHTISNLGNISENVSASRSRIQDTDYAVETSKLTNTQIKQQAITSMMTISSNQSELMLRLLG